MARALTEHMFLFSKKQQKYLKEQSALTPYFTAHAEAQDDDKKQDFSASKVEEMMARCRDFVRTQQSSRGEREGDFVLPDGSDGTGVSSLVSAEQSSENRQKEKEQLWQ